MNVLAKWKGKVIKISPNLSSSAQGRKQGIKKILSRRIIMKFYIYTASPKFYLLIQINLDSSLKTWRWINIPRSIPKSITESSHSCSSAESFLCSHSYTASHLMDYAIFMIDCLFLLFLFRKHPFSKWHCRNIAISSFQLLQKYGVYLLKMPASFTTNLQMIFWIVWKGFYSCASYSKFLKQRKLNKLRILY